MENNPIVTAVITTHNRCNLLHQAIDSVLAQEYHPIEIIVVDDASDDNTEQVCRDFGGAVTYVKIAKEESKGGNHARNVGVSRAKGEYIAFLDDDDTWFPSKVSKQIRIFQEVDDCALVHCGMRVNYVENNVSIGFKDASPLLDRSGDLHKQILFDIMTVTSCIMVKKSDLLNVGMFDEQLKFWQEYELTIRLAQIGEFRFVPEPLVNYRVDRTDPNRRTNKFFAWRDSVRYIYNKHRSLYSELTFAEKLRYHRLVCLDAIPRCISSGTRCYVVLYRLRAKMLDLLIKVLSPVK